LLLKGVLKYPEDEQHQDERISAMLKFMEYLRQTGRVSVFIKYVNYLVDQHISSNNLPEAGLTILMHADLLQWDDQLLSEISPLYPSETSRQRKERIYMQALQYLDKGQLWEKAIDLIRELRMQYETVTFDYQKLADILQTEAGLFKKITTSERFFSMYFKVGFFGKGFEEELCNLEFIYRGFELERISDFSQRIMSRFPNAVLLNFTEYPGQEILNSPSGQNIQIVAVKAATKDDMESREKVKPKNIPPSVQKYNNENNVNVFSYSRAIKKSKAKDGNEFRDLWILNTYFETADIFPAVQRKSLVIKKKEVEVTPVDNAINAIQDKSKELLEVITKHENGGRDNISPFTMVLKGVIDAAVNGGTKLYRDAFLSADYLVIQPDKKPSVNKLKESFREQLEIVEKGLIIHAKICPEDLSSLQTQLEETFAKTKQDLLKDISIT